MASGSVVLRLPSGLEMPVNFDYERQLERFLDERLPVLDSLFSRTMGKPFVNPLTCDNSPEILSPPYPPLPPIQLSELQWPSGASRYARGLFVVDGYTLAQLAAECWGWSPPGAGDPAVFVPDDWGGTQKQLEICIAGESIFRAKMYALAPYRVGGSGTGLTASPSYWLLPLVDARYYYSRGVHESTTTAPESVASLFSTLAGEMSSGLTVSVDPIAAAYGSVIDKRLYETEVPQPAANLLDVAALSYGLRIVVDPSTGQMRAIGPSASEQRRKANMRGIATAPEELATLISGGNTGLAGFDASIAIFVRSNGSYIRKKAIPTTSLGDTFPEIGQRSGDLGPNPQFPIYTSWIQTSSNATATQNYVNEIANSINAWANTGGQYAIAGAFNYLPSGFDDFLSIQVIETDSNGDGELEPFMRSRVYELPAMFGPWVYLVGGELEQCGGRIGFYILAEDADTDRPWVWAKYAILDTDTGLIGLNPDNPDLFKLYHCEYELSSPIYAKAGYKGKYFIESGNLVHLTGPCIEGCQAEGSINLDLPDGEVGTAYTHTVSGTTIDADTIDVVDLPDGLTFNAATDEITGTPTVAGVFHVVLMAEAANGCLVTKIQDVTITEAP